MTSKRITTLYVLIITIGSLVACEDLVSSGGEAEIAEQTAKSAKPMAKSAEPTVVEPEASPPETALGVLTAFTSCDRTCSSASGPVTNQTTCKLNCKASAAVRYESLAEGPEKPEKPVFDKAIARMGACLDSCGMDLSEADRETCILVCNNTVAMVLEIAER